MEAAKKMDIFSTEEKKESVLRKRKCVCIPFSTEEHFVGERLLHSTVFLWGQALGGMFVFYSVPKIRRVENR